MSIRVRQTMDKYYPLFFFTRKIFLKSILLGSSLCPQKATIIWNKTFQDVMMLENDEIRIPQSTEERPSRKI